MPYIQLDAQQYPLVAGDNVVGSDAEARIRLSGGGVESVAAVLQVDATGGAVIRRGATPGVKVNGVVLGAEPSPLIHGDKIEVGGRELYFGDDRKAGSTQYVPSVKLPELQAHAHAPTKPTAATGGRLVSLVDGREYAVPAAGLVIGRDPTCDVVVPSSEVSRKHAVIAATSDGYLLTDTSTNGVLVNGEPVGEPQLLGRGDVLKVADEEFRFYADNAAPARPALARLEVVSSGVLKGKAFEIRSPLTHVGRGAHNDVVIPDESVSDTHAKLQRRESGWIVVDMNSTNGTYVGGRRIAGEQQLVGAPDLRFGGVKFIFKPAVDADAAGAGHTRAIASLKGEAATARGTVPQPRSKTPATTTPRKVRAVPSPAAASAPVSRSTSTSSIVLWVVLLLVLGAAVLFLLTSH